MSRPSLLTTKGSATWHSQVERMKLSATPIGIALVTAFTLTGCANSSASKSVAQDGPVPSASGQVSEDTSEIACPDRVALEDRSRATASDSHLPFEFEPGHVKTRQERFQHAGSWAEARYPSSYAGAWLTDHRSGKRLMMAFTDCADHRASRAAAAAGVKKDLVDARVVPLTLDQLQAISDRALSNFDELRSLGIHAISVDEPTNKVEVISEVSPSDVEQTAIQRILRSTALTFTVGKPPAETGSD
jgi:hypothetical protein